MTGLGPISVMLVMAVLLLLRILGLIWLNKCGDALASGHTAEQWRRQEGRELGSGEAHDSAPGPTVLHNSQASSIDFHCIMKQVLFGHFPTPAARVWTED